MYRFLLLPTIAILLIINAEAQDDDFYTNKKVLSENKTKQASQKSDYTVFFGLGLGINNSCGIIGTQIEYSPLRKFSVLGGLGISTWGYKAALGARLYNRSFPHKLFYGLTFTTTSGINEVEMELETTNSPNEKVDLRLNSAKNLALTIGYQWRLFKYGRLNFEAGYSIPLQSVAYEVLSPGVELTEESERLMNFMTPGGIVLGLAFTVGF